LSFCVDASREKGAVEILSTLLNFKHAVFTRTCVKLSTLKPDERRTNIKTVQANIDINDNNASDSPASDPPEIEYELCEAKSTTVLYSAYKNRPMFGISQLSKKRWDNVCLLDFTALYTPTTQGREEGRNTRVELLDGSFWAARNRRAVVLFYPYISINVDNEKSAYSLLVSYSPFRDESELIPAQFDGSAVAALRAQLSSDSPSTRLPFAVRNRISHRENMQGVVDAINSRNDNLDPHHSLQDRDTVSFDIDDMDELNISLIHDDEGKESTTNSSHSGNGAPSADMMHTRDNVLLNSLLNSFTLIKGRFANTSSKQDQPLEFQKVISTLDIMKLFAKIWILYRAATNSMQHIA